MLEDSLRPGQHTGCDCIERIAEISRVHQAEHVQPVTWDTDPTPLPYLPSFASPPGKTALPYVARFMRFQGRDGVGTTLGECRRALRPHLTDDAIRRAWNTLIHMGRLSVVRGTSLYGPSEWVPRAGDPT